MADPTFQDPNLAAMAAATAPSTTGGDVLGGYRSGPVAPSFIDTAASTTGDLLASAKASAVQQQQRLNDYIQHLYQVRDLAMKSAQGVGSRAGGAQNPMAQYQAMQDLAGQAGVPWDNEIAKTLQGSNNIENTLNGLISQAGQMYAHLGSIPATWGQGTTLGGGGSGATIGGKRSGSGGGSFNAGGGGQRYDIRGNLVDANGNILSRSPDQQMADNAMGNANDRNAYALGLPTSGENTFDSQMAQGGTGTPNAFEAGGGMLPGGRGTYIAEDPALFNGGTGGAAQSGGYQGWQPFDMVQAFQAGPDALTDHVDGNAPGISNVAPSRNYLDQPTDPYNPTQGTMANSTPSPATDFQDLTQPATQTAFNEE